MPLNDRELAFVDKMMAKQEAGSNMNAEEVCAMIDAITEGRDFETQVDTDEETAQLMISCGIHGFTFETLTPFGPIGARILDPRIAREIVGALIAWADRKEGVDNRAKYREVFPPKDCIRPEVWHASGTHRRKHIATGECDV